VGANRGLDGGGKDAGSIPQEREPQCKVRRGSDPTKMPCCMQLC
jgi:hypothetical protein